MFFFFLVIVKPVKDGVEVSNSNNLIWEECG
jgi:hypothetical protein